jgi:anhydro-N-acetylmuramic acid kinase
VPDLLIGLMSGTSLDGADGVLVDLSSRCPQVIASASTPFAAGFRAELLALNRPGDNELHRAALAGNQIAVLYAQVVHDLLAQARCVGITAADVRAIGAHGQTVRHRPGATPGVAGDANAYTLQLNNPALLAELTGIDVVADLRSRDIAAGGQGAPLVPAFHQQVFAQSGRQRSVLNIGGIANLSVLPARLDAPVLGFDCGPGNALMDHWCQQHTGQAFDDQGAWAAGGQCQADVLQALLDEPYFTQPPPKSTGRDLFSVDWLQRKLADFANRNAQDIQRTLLELTASACCTSFSSYSKDSDSLIVCGGGAFNHCLMQRLQALLPGVSVMSSEPFGLPPLQVEAAAFAWLAQQTLARLAGNLPSVTGAAGPRVLGAIYPA